MKQSQGPDAILSRIQALVERLRGEGVEDSEIRKRIEEELILIKRELRLKQWSDLEHVNHAFPLTRTEQPSE